MGNLNDQNLLSSLVSYKEQNIEVFLSSFSSTQQQEEQLRNITSPYTPLRCHLGDIVNNEIEDAVRYLKLCEEGQVYEYLGNKAGIDISTTKKRNTLKKKVFSQVLFARRHEMHGDVAKAFQQTFPSIWKMIREVKQTDYKRLAHWMQRLESQFVIDRVVENFRTKNPEAFVMTIHDSVLVKPKHLKVIRGSFLKEFGRLGVHPALRSK